LLAVGGQAGQDLAGARAERGVGVPAQLLQAQRLKLVAEHLLLFQGGDERRQALGAGEQGLGGLAADGRTVGAPVSQEQRRDGGVGVRRKRPNRGQLQLGRRLRSQQIRREPGQRRKGAAAEQAHGGGAHGGRALLIAGG